MLRERQNKFEAIRIGTPTKKRNEEIMKRQIHGAVSLATITHQLNARAAKLAGLAVFWPAWHSHAVLRITGT
jgi:hypothetical protein